MLTKAQKQAYFQNPSECPYCGSGNITAEPIDGERQRVSCSECDMEWFDILKLIDIEEVV